MVSLKDILVLYTTIKCMCVCVRYRSELFLNKKEDLAEMFYGSNVHSSLAQETDYMQIEYARMRFKMNIKSKDVAIDFQIKDSNDTARQKK